ncbi:hypothetical protein D1816_14465 [Aquimarina sp. AD10]|nr:hypothetical protein D1816_14465 [Aquimarina sp. AD10]RKM89989.1 hypothetical protein D7033_24985 [Aquimarina sp. AD10]
MKLMKLIKIAALGLLVCLSNFSLNAQSKKQSYSFKKGEILDILLLTTKPEGGALFDRYKKTAFPVASKRSYKPQPGFIIKESTQSSFHPQNFLFGKWDNLESREKFLAEIETEVPDFHKQRRDIWSIFNMTYYEMTKDISFEIDRNKYNVVTSYWKKDANAFNTFKKEWIQKSKNKGGKNILALTKGISPLGYYYNPDYMVITQWKNKAAFDAFYKENLKMNHKGVKDVNQFVIN